MFSQRKYDEIGKKISIIVPIRNEEKFIRKCLDSLINQDFERERYEIIVVDGMSDDRTSEILREYKEGFPSLIRVFCNDKKIQAVGKNIGIKNSSGDIIVLFDGHGFVDSEYLNVLLRNLENVSPDVAGIGAVLFAPEDETAFGKIMADVQDTILGGAGTGWRKITKRAYVKSIPVAAYRKNIIEKVGLYDERFVLSEDLELNWRIRKAGFRLMTSPELKVYYYRKHSSLKQMLPKMYRYGTWRALFYKKKPDSLNLLFLIPTIILLSIISLPATLFFFPLLAQTTLVGLAIYIGAVLASSLHLIVKHKDSKYLLSIPIYLLEHLGMGAGFLTGLFRRIPKRK